MIGRTIIGVVVLLIGISIGFKSHSGLELTTYECVMIYEVLPKSERPAKDVLPLMDKISKYGISKLDTTTKK